MKNLRKRHDRTPTITNAHHNRTQAQALFEAGFKVRDIVRAFPEVFKLTVEDGKDKLGLKYTDVYLDSGLKEQDRMIDSVLVDRMIQTLHEPNQ